LPESEFTYLSKKIETPDVNAFKAIGHLRDSIAGGRDWTSALLESMEMWTLPEEYYKGRYYRYVIAGEAFDWLVLAERLLIDIQDLIPLEDTTELLFSGSIGADLTANDFKRLLGSAKYSAYLNYWYGIVVEEALLRCVEQEELKKALSSGLTTSRDMPEKAFNRLYGKEQKELFKKFRIDNPDVPNREMTLTESKEFTYWLFKYRVSNSDGSRIASDTRKAIMYLQKQGVKGF
tara:strand:+ start:805 stop:1506 length:702 start_codon:yes stop_codon:yes gene_type:complete